MSSSHNIEQPHSLIAHQARTNVRDNNDKSVVHHTGNKGHRRTHVQASQTPAKSSVWESTAHSEPETQKGSNFHDEPYRLNIDNINTLADLLRQQSPEEIVGDSPYSSFLDFTQLYELQGGLADQRQELIQGLDDEVLEPHRNNEAASALSTMNASVVPPKEPALSSTVPTPPQPPHRAEEGRGQKAKTQANAHARKEAADSSTMAPSHSPSPSTSPKNTSSLPQNFDKVPESTAEQSGAGNQKPPTISGARSASAVFTSAGILRQQSAGGPPPAGIVGTTTMSTTLPSEKVFSIQIGSEIFRLSGASISSDGQYRYAVELGVSLKTLEHRHIFPIFLRNNFVKQQRVVL
jgi:hypothetical protein